MLEGMSTQTSAAFESPEGLPLLQILGSALSFRRSAAEPENVHFS